MTARAYTADELRDILLGHINVMVEYWRTCELHPGQDRLSGLAFSILVALDGHSGGFPCALDLVARPHEEDKQFCINEGENWVEDGTVLNEDVLLHELFYPKQSST